MTFIVLKSWVFSNALYCDGWWPLVCPVTFHLKLFIIINEHSLELWEPQSHSEHLLRGILTILTAAEKINFVSNLGPLNKMLLLFILFSILQINKSHSCCLNSIFLLFVSIRLIICIRWQPPMHNCQNYFGILVTKRPFCCIVL